jgi:SAM-dependent methyltransferase
MLVLRTVAQGYAVTLRPAGLPGALRVARTSHTSPHAMSIRSAVAALQKGDFVSDQELDDALFPAAYGGSLSQVHWTPVEVSLHAVALLAEGGRRRILDIGAGVGKFCILGALTTPAAFVGIEQRLSLVETARLAAARSGASRASFVHANVVDVDFAEFDGFYLYNPFYEQIALDRVRIDETIERSYKRFLGYVADTTRKLRHMPSGTRVVTYNGLGGDMPPEYVHMPVTHRLWGEFALWIRR